VVNIKKGFTLIELIVVAALLSILAIAVITIFSKGILDKARENATKANLASLREAIRSYYGETEGEYPRFLSDKVVEVEVNGVLKKFSFLPSEAHEGFFQADPKDPSKPNASALLKRDIPNNDSNNVTYLGNPNSPPLKDGVKPTIQVKHQGGWIYCCDPDGGFLIGEGIKIRMDYGDIRIFHSEVDISKKSRYFEY
jgi:prepilin-type N-terminal cleavage/methylation domain-containing protein